MKRLKKLRDLSIQEGFQIQFEIDKKADKTYVVAESAKRLALSGGTMTGQINMGGNKVVNVATPANASDVATKKFVDDEVKNSRDMPLTLTV